MKCTVLTTITEGDHNTLYSQCDALILVVKTSMYEQCNVTLSWKQCVQLLQCNHLTIGDCSIREY